MRQESASARSRHMTGNANQQREVRRMYDAREHSIGRLVLDLPHNHLHALKQVAARWGRSGQSGYWAYETTRRRVWPVTG